jgi:hypothetical protein
LVGLAEGLTHELNNPAAAANRTITQLSDSIQEWRFFVERLNVQHGMTANEWSYISELRKQTTYILDSKSPGMHSPSPGENSSPTTRSIDTNDPLAQAEEEDKIVDWFRSHGVNDGWKLASDLVNSGLTIDKLDDASANIPSSHPSPKSTINEIEMMAQKNTLLEDIFSWLNVATRVDRLIYEIKSSNTRISQILSAVKSYSFVHGPGSSSRC